MKRPLFLTIVLALCSTGAWADMYEDCNQNEDTDRQIRGCTQVIERGKQESQENRSFAYNNRGFAYEQKGEYDRAIADLTKAIALNRNYTAAYNNRGVAYEHKRDKEKAIEDYRKVLEIDPSHQEAKNSLKLLGAAP